MAAAFLDLAKIAQSYEFQQRVAYAMSVASLAVYSEAVDGVTITQAQHTARANYARQVLAGTFFLGSAALMFAALGVATNATIASEASLNVSGNGIADADIQFQVNSMWNALAGA